MGRIAVIAGSTGLVGSHCLRILQSTPEYERVIAPVRGPSGLKFDFTAADDVFCAIGTTMKKAGSKDAFRRVDFDLPLALARHSVGAGARRFLLVSSVGADPLSSNFYLKTKGELERELAALPFDALHIFRPSLLLGGRKESRPGEQFGAAVAPIIAPLLLGPLRKYRAVPAGQVAEAMIRAALSTARGRHVHHFDDIRR